MPQSSVWSPAIIHALRVYSIFCLKASSNNLNTDGRCEMRSSSLNEQLWSTLLPSGPSPCCRRSPSRWTLRERCRSSRHSRVDIEQFICARSTAQWSPSRARSCHTLRSAEDRSSHRARAGCDGVAEVAGRSACCLGHALLTLRAFCTLQAAFMQVAAAN
jgi:hypothetical protein